MDTKTKHLVGEDRVEECTDGVCREATLLEDLETQRDHVIRKLATIEETISKLKRSPKLGQEVKQILDLLNRF